MNEQLKFSWGHIIAYLALIFISFISFDGLVYLTGGDFKTAGIGMFAIDIILFIFFIVPQFLKATERKFSVRIWFERFLRFLSPIVFVALMAPFFHFWTVHSRESEIEKQFTNAISNSKNIFKEYEQYCDLRLNEYDSRLASVISGGSRRMLRTAGFSSDDTEVQKNSMLKALRLQLLSPGYYDLRNAAVDWIEDCDKGVSTFNVFIIGNIREIRSAIKGWNEQLDSISQKVLYNESPLDTFSEYQKIQKVNDALASLDSLRMSFTPFRSSSAPKDFSFARASGSLLKSFTAFGSKPGVIPIALAVVLYLAMLAPYFLQDRHTKSRERLFGRAKVSVPDSIAHPQEDNDDWSIFTPNK